MTLQGCVAIADDAKSLVIIRPKNGAEEGIITRLGAGMNSISDEDVKYDPKKKKEKEKYDFFQLEMMRLNRSKRLFLKIRNILCVLIKRYIFTKE